MDGKGRSLPRLGAEINPATVHIDDDIMRYGQALSGSLADFLGGEERIKNAVLYFFRDAASGIAYLDFNPVAVLAGGDGDTS